MRFAAPKKTKRIPQTGFPPDDPSHVGGSIRRPITQNVKVDKRDTAFTKALYNRWDDEEDDGFYDHEVAMYTHFGGRLSGRGAAGDSPRTVRFMHSTLKQYPEVLAAYHSGKVANLSEQTW